MKITCWNVNGLRSPSMSIIDNKLFNKESNLYKLLKEYDPDILCIGETKCQKKNEEMFNNLIPFKYNLWNSSTEKLGYSGVCVFSKHPFKNLGSVPGLESDNFGRNILLEFDKFILCHVYTPNSGGNKDSYRKDFWDKNIYEFLKNKNEKPIIYCGDLNIVHTENDIYNPLPLKKGNSPGTKKYERDNFQSFLDLGYYDAHRYLFPEQKMWTWWDPRSRARNKDAGWRLDYFLISNKDIIKDGVIHKDIHGSDHCPISLEILI
tara:strand:+ start:628 stop:1416 length:789 start_codon:yes stop_codon:yes gene_type:complete